MKHNLKLLDGTIQTIDCGAAVASSTATVAKFTKATLFKSRRLKNAPQPLNFTTVCFGSAT